jgi:uncharacterized protein (DUF488 family)
VDLFTVGYEGCELSDFLSTLERVGINQIIDVRAVPLSRKRGFSKNSLAAALRKCGIRYVHLRALGDPKPGRDAARRGDFSAFRKIYRRHIETVEGRGGIAEAREAAKAMTSALLCYERNPEHCHRSIIARILATEFRFSIRHIGVAAHHMPPSRQDKNDVAGAFAVG